MSGMYTHVVSSDVSIVDLEGLKQFLENIKTGNYEEYKGKEYLAEFVNISDDGKYLDFEGMDDHKIISYWYDETVLFLRDLAVFIEGGVELEYENNDEGGRLDFSNGECTITTGRMQWQENKPEDFFREDTLNYKPTHHPLRKELKERLLLRKITEG